MSGQAMHSAEGATSRDRATIAKLTDHICRARLWAWTVHDDRIPGAARDLAWALIGLARDYDPATYAPWSQTEALEPAQMNEALSLAIEIARLIRKADALQPHLVRKVESVDYEA